nr:nicotinate phosphoribosyltransferase [Rhodococcus sp. (in: high G+C Gram-positive bacteria)]
MTTASPIYPLMLTDGYKLDHRRMYPSGTTTVYSNWTNRGSRMPEVDKVVHFGLQATLQKYFVEIWEPFFAADVDEIDNLYFNMVANYLGPDAAFSIGTQHVRDLHKLGYLPLRVCSMPEGTLIPIGVPSFTIENTVDEFFWLVNYVESVISASYWHRSTSATVALEYRKILDAAAVRTGASTEAVDFQAHDFSFRGQTSVESAEASGAGHLLSFSGTDSLPALDFIRRYYPGENGFVGGSIPATEHSVMCARLQDGEQETFEHLLDLYPTGPLAVVSDTWDLWNVITKILPALRDKILARDGKLVIRPDSGDPEAILLGDKTAPYGSPAWFGVVELLADGFGRVENDEGFFELESHIGVIYGDAITLERAESITNGLEKMGYASTTVVFGVGSYSYQGTTRDTFSSAIKATYTEANGVPANLQKDPITANGSKKSATGRLAVLENDGEMVLFQKAKRQTESISLLQPVWQDGKALVTQSFADVRLTLVEQ